MVRNASAWWLVAVLAATAGAPLHADDSARPIQLGGGIGAAYDSNVGNAPSFWPADADSLETLNASAEYFAPITLFTSVLVRGSLDGEVYNKFSKLSNGKATLLSRLFFRPGGDFFTPLLAGWVSGSYAKYGSSLRDGADYRGGVYVSEQVTTAISARLDIAASRRNASDASFDAITRWAGLSVDWLLPGSVTAYGGYQYRTGQVTSTFSCTAAGPYGGGGGSDDGLGDAADCAYKVKARTQVATLGANIPLGANLSFDLQGQYAKSSATSGGLDYTRWLTFASLLARF